MNYVVAFFIFLVVNVQGFCSDDPFVQNMHALLEGGRETELRYDANQELIITIQKEVAEQDEYFIIKFTTPEHQLIQDEGAFLLVFPVSEKSSVGYLRWLHKISSGYSGTKLLEVLSEFCSQMQLKTVLLVDASEVVDEHCSCVLSLKKSHILSSERTISWYESKGFQPVSESTIQNWYNWLLKERAVPYHYVQPVPQECYRTAAEAYANLNCSRYLQALEAMDQETGFFSEGVEMLREIVRNGPDATAKELYKVRDNREGLLKALEEPFSEDVELEFYSKMAQSRTSHSADVSYAGILLLQMHLRDTYNLQFADGRREFLDQVLGVFEGKRFAYKPDNTFLLKVAARFGMASGSEGVEEEDEDDEYELIQLGLEYLADTPLNIFPEHEDSTETVKEAVRARTGDEQRQFLETLVFGNNSSLYYDGVSAHIKKLLTSDGDKEFFFGHMVNQMILESAAIMEKSF